jgi:nicotinamidase-related amidase
MQRLFTADGPWPTPWMPRVLPVVAEVAGWAAERTIFTRFIPPREPDDLPGRWQAYYRRWRTVTRARLDPALLELLPELSRFVPPARVIDKTRYSAFIASGLLDELRARHADTLIVTGSETDVCVLATVANAVDLGYRVVIIVDGVCSSADEHHDALLNLYSQRFSEQVETATAEQVLAAWSR